MNVTPDSIAPQADPSPDVSRSGRSAGLLPANRRVLATISLLAALPLLILTPLVMARWEPLIWFDTGAALHLYGMVHPQPELGEIIETWTDVFGTRIMIGLGVLVTLWFALRRRFASAAWALCATGTAGAVGWVWKHTVERARPEFTDPIATGSGPAFPSGHALMATVGMGVLLLAALPLLRGLWRWVAVMVALGIAVSTGGTRPLLGVHWVSDVVAGASLGVLVLAGTLLVLTWLPQALQRWDHGAPFARSAD